MALAMTKISGTLMSSVAAQESAMTWGATALSAGSGEVIRHVAVQFALNFNASATGDAVLHLRKSADGGTTDDNLETALHRIVAPGTSTAQVITVDVYDFDHLEVGVSNEDATYDITVNVKYKGSKITGLD